jgi:YfiH family protein
MISSSPGSVRYFSFDSLQAVGVIQAIFTRRGGVSMAPFASLNTGGTVGDDPQAVAENRKRCFSTLGCDIQTLFDVWQVHSANVVIAEAPRSPDTPHEKADVILTDRPGVTLFMRFADCVPILLVDPVRRAIGMAHAGWVGSVARVAAVAVQAMIQQYDCRPEDIQAGIGPSIGVEHYPVGEDVINQVKHSFPADFERLLIEYADGIHFDLWKANRISLEEQGITHIEEAGICTACHLEDWFSHRGEVGKTGRFGALLSLKAESS